MIERFNFYDLYGYLLPGSTLLTLALVPSALSKWELPNAEWGSAIAFLILSYLTGHILQAVARTAFPSTVLVNHSKKAKYPSEIVFDEHDTTLPKALKSRLAKTIQDKFGIDPSEPSQRQAAFNLCRQTLQASDSPSYAEQFQGLYALMRGLQAAGIVASGQYVGWILGSLAGDHWWQTAVVVVGVAAIFWIALSVTRYGFWSLVALAFALGALGGTALHLTSARRLGLFLLVAALIGMVRVAGQSYRAFAMKFATTVYEAYLVRSLKT